MECAPKLIKKFSENKSYCDSKLKKFFWSIKFNFLDNTSISKVIKVENIPNILKNKSIKKIISLENFEKHSLLFENPFDDAINNLTSIYKYKDDGFQIKPDCC